LPGETLPEGHWGTEDTIEKLKEIAEVYYDLTDRILSINDISLPRGGLFDYEETWNPPHAEHRTGTDADINRGQGPNNEDIIDCYHDKDLRRAVEKVAAGQTRPYLQCENLKRKRVPPNDKSGKFKHIDFD